MKEETLASFDALENELRNMRKLSSATPQPPEDQVELCFRILSQYANLDSVEVTDEAVTACCYAATVLSGFVDRKLAERTKKFLNTSTSKIHPRATEVLQHGLLRMSGF